jgi:hypothetical protein
MRPAALGVVIAIAFGSLFVVRFFRGPDRSDYLAKNELIVHALPLPAGAREVMRQILRNEHAVDGELLSHTVGYTTYVTYAVREEMSSKGLVAFYDRKLPGWRSTHWRVGKTAFACFAKDGAIVNVQPEGLDPPTARSPETYGIAVDHHGGGGCD